jgi:hypothetical protein
LTLSIAVLYVAHMLTCCGREKKEGTSQKRRNQ